jgi:hypothetical protein
MKSVSMGEAITGMANPKSMMKDSCEHQFRRENQFHPLFFILGVLKVLSLSFFFLIHPQFWQN